MIKFQIRRKTAKVWQHFIVDGSDFIFSKCYCKTNGDKFRVVEDGGTQKNEYNFDEIEVYDDLNSGSAETFTSSLELMERLSVLGYVGFNKDGDVVIADLISTDPSNALEEGTDGKLFVSASGGGGGSWGSITGTLSDQTDLQSALDAKQDTLEFTPENVANKENTTLDTSTTKYPTNRLVKEYVDANIITDKDVFGTTQNEWIGYPSGWVSTNQPTTTGTADNVSPSFAGNEFLKTWRRRYVSASTAGSSVEFRDASFRNIAIGSGFTAVFKFGFEDASAVANARSFVGFYGSNATFGNVNPSAQTNLVGVSNDTGEANLQLIHRGSGATTVKVDLGANFPSNTIATDEYMLILVNEFGSTEVTYYVYRLNTSDVATGTITTDLPASTVGLSPYFWRNNGTTALAVRLSLMKYGLYKRF